MFSGEEVEYCLLVCIIWLFNFEFVVKKFKVVVKVMYFVFYLNFGCIFVEVINFGCFELDDDELRESV